MDYKISVLGLGAGDLEQLTIGMYRKLKEGGRLFLRTKEHPVVRDLVKEGIQFTSFDEVYERHDRFADVYEEITERLFQEVKKGNITYAVPGHPLVAEQTVQMLLERSKNTGIEVVIEGGQSFLDPLFSSLKIDPIEGFQFLDGTSLRESDIHLTQHVVIGQVYDQFVASEVKLALMERLPDDYEVVLVTAVGSKEEKIKRVPLYELDHEVELSNLTSVYIPPVQDERLLYGEFQILREVIATLRGPNGCPWDRKQTHQSLKKYLVEETYEVLDAIDAADDDWMVEELGDVLLQVMLHAQIGEDDGYFSINDVIATLTEKMIRRHPHVFGATSVQSAEEVEQNWELIKRTEKQGIEEKQSILDGIPKELPSLYKAYELQKKAAKVGFDWQDIEPMWAKVKEEIIEFQNEVANGNKDKLEKEFGDIIFAFVNIARFYKVDPEEALRATNHKFYKRFQYIEESVRRKDKKITDFSLEELDAIWEEAKTKNVEQ